MASLLSWYSIAPVSRTSRARIPLKPWFFQASCLQLLKLENVLRRSFFTFIYNPVHIRSLCLQFEHSMDWVESLVKEVFTICILLRSLLEVWALRSCHKAIMIMVMTGRAHCIHICIYIYIYIYIYFFFFKWTTTLSFKQDMFRSFNDHLQLWIRLQVRLILYKQWRIS